MYDPASAIKGLEAVEAAQPEHAGLLALTGLATDAKFDRDEMTLTVAGEDVVAACEALKAAGYNFFEDATAVDWYPSEPRFQITYHILSLRMKQRVRLVVRLDGDMPALNSITGVWPSANFYEREIFDLFGVRFGGHPNLVRIMMPEDWQGHPLRKDYPVEGYR
jgi:NADH-quinone oxidoreductase subunit C